MKSTALVALVAAVSSATAFAPLYTHRAPTTSLQASKPSEKSENWWTPAATALVGWTLATQIAGASVIPANSDSVSPTATFQQAAPTTLVAAETIDFSLPSSYNPNMGGFGDGSEARLQEAKGGDEGDKQKEAMRKAEENRQQRLAEKKAEAKLREEEGRARAQAKKEAQKDRFKEIFQ